MPNTHNPLSATHQAKFITFEGGEGVGKSTQLKLLSDAFIKAGFKTVTTREPGGTEGAESIRNLLVNGDTTKWAAETELLLHLAARNDHVNKFIKPSLVSGVNIICDRFTDSTIAYQSYGHGISKEFVRQMCNLVLGNFQPDLTIILDMEVESGIERTEKRFITNNSRGPVENRYERMGLDFHKRIRNGFLEISNSHPQRCVVINADSDIDSLQRKIIAEVNNRLGIKL